MIGQVRPVVMPMREVVAAMAPSTLQAKGECPWLSSQGWKWSEMETKSKPASSARLAFSTRAEGPCSSVISLYPNLTMCNTPLAEPPGSRVQTSEARKRSPRNWLSRANTTPAVRRE
jgi:hypothetical protein